MTNFTDLGLVEPLLKALAAEGYDRPTTIQAQAIPHVLEGRDVLGLAQTGTGKTAAFALPILQRLIESPRKAAPRSARVLVLSPTRELAAQIEESFRSYGRHLSLRFAVIYGGVGFTPQIKRMSRGVDVLIATPGRLMDLMGQRHVQLGSVETFVLDEADRMLDLGFIQPIRKIAEAVPAERQTLLFSATMPPAIAALAASLQRQPVRVEAAAVSSTAERIEQKVLFVERANKRALLRRVLQEGDIERALVFARTKRGADRVAKNLETDGVSAASIHGDKSQGARRAALEGFRRGKVRVLVATDIAARGIDIDGISHVINFDLPDTPESYVHRIGRTARAGAEGTALSFCDEEQGALLRDIEKTIRQPIPVDEAHPFHADGVIPLHKPAAKAKPARGNGRPRQRRGGGRRQGSGRRAA